MSSFQYKYLHIIKYKKEHKLQNLLKIEKRVIGAEELNSVNARDLYKALGIKQDFSSWIKKQLKVLGLEINVDYVKLTRKSELSKTGQILIEYIITTDTAKHISMASRTAKGKEVRDYFIAVEKEFLACGNENETLNQILPVLQSMVNMMSVMMENQNKMMQMMMQQQEQQQKQIANALTPDQLDKIKIGVMRATKPLAEAHNFSWGEATRKVYTELNGRMGVFSYYQIAPADYDEAIALLGRMKKQKEELLATGEVKTMLSVDVKAEVAS